MKGITILAFGHPAYGKMAHNLAVSIKHHSDLPIQLIQQGDVLSHLDEWMKNVFDYVDELDIDHPKVNPALAKLIQFGQLRFDETILLDADSLAIQDATALFGECTKSYHVQTYEMTEGDNEKHLWANVQDVRKKYQIKKDNPFPITSTAFQYYRKTQKSERIIKRAIKYLTKQPMKRKGLRNQWGGKQPDELYVNASMAKEGHDPSIKNTPEPILFTEQQVPSMDEIKNNHYFIGFGTDRTHVTLLRLYDMLLKKYYRDFYYANPVFKHNMLFDNKHIFR